MEDFDNKSSNQQRIKEITEQIESGIRELYESDHYRSYLSTMSRFHKYSVNNTLLIHLQRPDATLVAGFNTWKNKFGRHVKRGEKGIQVIAPATSQRKVREPALDKDTKEPIFDADGNAVMEEHTVRITRFKPVTVFDVSQTDGKPLPKLAQSLNGSVEQYDAFLEALRRSAPVPIEFEVMAAGTDGYFSADQQRIAIREGMSQVQTVSAVVHEVAHSKLHDYDKYINPDAEAPHKKDRRTEEVEAESISYSVCQYYGIETAENSLGYIASWSKGKELKELKASLETIQKTASALIDDIDRNFAAICRERGFELEQKEAPVEEAPSFSSTSDAPAEMVADASDTPPTPVQSVDPYLAYARAVCDHEEELGRAGMISLPFGGHDKETFSVMYAETLRSSGLKNARAVLDDYTAQTGYPTPERLYQQLEALTVFRDSHLTFEITTMITDPNVSTISSFGPDGNKEDAMLFTGPTTVCKKLLDELRAGSITASQVREIDQKSYSMDNAEHSDAPQPEHTLLDMYPMPDASVEMDALEKAGCPDAATMLPLHRDRARDLLAEGFTVYMIDENGDPMMCFDELEIGAAGDLLALERLEWEKSPDFRALVRDQRIECQAEREAAFLHYPVDAFAIYQISDQSPQRRDRLFTDLDSLKRLSMEPSREHYDLIYTGTLADHPAVKAPEDAFRVFNLERPHDFGGHSLSVSDIVAFRRNGVVSYHYCDSCGFAEIPDFQKPENYLKNAEMAMEDDYGMIDGIINNGPKDRPPQPETPKTEQSSLLERLRCKQEEVEEQKRQKAKIAEICASIS